MPLLKGTAMASDPWTTLGPDDAVPATGDIIVPLARLLAQPELAAGHQGKLGVLVANNDRIEKLAPYLDRIAIVALPFPAFTDGRAYSQARQLREMGYRGELRATGNVLPDQLQFMRQVGFQSFEIGERFPVEVWLKASRQMSLAYQRGLFRPVGEAEIWSERHGQAKPALERPQAG